MNAATELELRFLRSKDLTAFNNIDSTKDRQYINDLTVIRFCLDMWRGVFPRSPVMGASVAKVCELLLGQDRGGSGRYAGNLLEKAAIHLDEEGLIIPHIDRLAHGEEPLAHTIYELMKGEEKREELIKKTKMSLFSIYYWSHYCEHPDSARGLALDRVHRLSEGPGGALKLALQLSVPVQTVYSWKYERCMPDMTHVRSILALSSGPNLSGPLGATSAVNKLLTSKW